MFIWRVAKDERDDYVTIKLPAMRYGEYPMHPAAGLLLVCKPLGDLMNLPELIDLADGA